LKQAAHRRKKIHLYHQLTRVKDDQGEYAEAIKFYVRSIKINEKISSCADPDLASSYGNNGLVYEKMCEYGKALSYYDKTLEIFQKSLPSSHPSLATS
jgi:tetratricopeptide (TPR) repeat protein